MCEKYDDIKEKLLLPLKLKEKIENDVDELAAVKACMERITSILSLTGVHSRNTDSALEKNMIRCEEISERINKNVNEYAMALAWVNQAIDSVKRKEDRELLKYYYIDGKTMGEIIELLNFCNRSSFYSALARALVQIKE